MGSSHTKQKIMSSCSSCERAVEGLKNKVKLLEGEIDEIMRVRELESQAYERELMVFAFKQAEWKRERARLGEEVGKLRKVLEDQKQQLRKKGDRIKDDDDEEEEERAMRRRDETVEKWKQLYFAIKVELDHLIHRTHQEERLWWKREKEGVLYVEMKNEVRAKDEIIEMLQAKIAKVEQQTSKREREMDILRQSLRIMSHKKRPSIKLGHKSIR